MKYFLFNPTGNITALIADRTPAGEIMKREPACEQAGYVYYQSGSDIVLEMAGGEFCGNATMCAAYLFLMGHPEREDTEITVFVKGTGNTKVSFSGNMGSVLMPEPLNFSCVEGYPSVRFRGIEHVIIENAGESVLNNAETLVKQWCSGEALGLMFLDGNKLRPLVYVKAADTLFWENSCASGTTAVGCWKGCDVELTQPGGTLSFSDGKLTGTVELIREVNE